MQNKALQKKPSSTVCSSGLCPSRGLRKMGRKSGFPFSNKNKKKTLNLTSLSEERKKKWEKDCCMSVIFMPTVVRTTTKLKRNSY